ncbi:MAG: permease [Vicingaceae bacterium]|nr:MAG: permease [Vicingaceae bacterium]
MNRAGLKDYLFLHFIIFIWGFTAILGKLISLQAIDLVWFRLIFAMSGLVFLMWWKKIPFPKKLPLKLLWVGVIIALHWLTFFGSIKISNASVALVAISTAPVFSALMEPFFYKRKNIGIHELIVSLLSILGMALIFFDGLMYWQGMLLGVTSAFLAALFTHINAQQVSKMNALVISLTELTGAWFFLTILLSAGFFTKSYHLQIPKSMDWFYLMLLGWICTSFAFSASVEIMKKISPFTVTLSVNLEPVYGIVLAMLIFGEDEKMNLNFYAGAFILIFSVFFYTYLKYKSATKIAGI